MNRVRSGEVKELLRRVNGKPLVFYQQLLTKAALMVTGSTVAFLLGVWPEMAVANGVIQSPGLDLHSYIEHPHARFHHLRIPTESGTERRKREGEQRIPRRKEKKSGSLQGVVTTPSAAPIPAVEIRLRNLASGETYLTLTNAEGVFRIPDLPLGDYELRAEKEAFKPLAQTEIAILLADTLTLRLQLQPQSAMLEKSHRLPRRPEMTAPLEIGPSGEEEETDEGRWLPRRPWRAPIEKRAPVLTPGLTGAAPADPALGFTGSGSRPNDGRAADDFIPIGDRWRLGFPNWDRKTGYPAPFHRGRSFDPYNQNVLKGDYPIIGNHIFAVLTGASQTSVDARRVYTPSNVSAADPLRERFFGQGEQFALRQDFKLTFEVSKGNTAFKPQDWVFRITPVFNINYLNSRENGVVNIDVRRGTNRRDGQIAFQELFAEVKLADSPPGVPGFFRGLFGREKSPYYDFTSFRFGIQTFNSDFRGFIFRDQNLGYRLFGNNSNNRYQWNLAYFNLLEKDTNSELNTIFDSRHQDVAVFNLYRQDFIWKGYTIEASFHYSDDHAGNRDKGGLHFNSNDFLERPAPIGSFRPHNLNLAYLGFAGDGHIGRLNLSHAFYQAWGNDDFNPIAGRAIDINAQMLAVEASLDRDWVRIKGSFFWSSGDKDPSDADGRGFDAIFDEPLFAGGEFSFWNGQGLRLTGTGVNLVQPKSLLPNLRTSKGEGQANFVNPGLFLFNLGADLELTPKLRTLLNVNVLRFQHTEVFELLLFQAPIRHYIGTDYSIGVQYRPLLNNNVTIKGGVSALVPGNAFRDIFTSQTLYSTFVTTTLTF